MAQEYGELDDDSYIYIMNSLPSRYVEVLFPNQLGINLPANIALKFKVHSRGDVQITVGGIVQVNVTVEDGTDYYYELVYLKNESIRVKFEKIDQTRFEELLGLKHRGHIALYEESADYPINRESIAKRNKNRSGPSQGTGFLINKDGYILTNFHVIDNAKKILVKGVGGDHSIGFEAQVVGTDSRTDLALLRITSKLVTFEDPPYAFVTAKTVEQGESVVALGYPIRQVMGEEVKVTNGIINAKSGYKGAISEFQFSAAVQPGNSGGPLLNGQGQVVGMVTAKLNPEVTESVGYAVKSDHLMFFLDQFEGVNYRRAEASDAAPTLPQVVSASAPFVFVVETE
jgi:S1-C subfamily serine protease